MPSCEILEPGGVGAGSPALSSPRLPPCSQSGCERRLQLSLRKQGATGPGRQVPFWFSAFSLQRHPSSVIDEAGASITRTLRLPHLQPPP